jgi:branched-chain amino acid transport system substrate-binding protein
MSWPLNEGGRRIVSRYACPRTGKTLAAALGVALCWVGVAEAADPYRIDVILPLTGNGAFLGQGEQTALRILEKEVNADGGIRGQPVLFNIQDDGSSAQSAVQLSSQVLGSHPAVMLGPALVAGCNALVTLTKLGPVMYCVSAGFHPALGSFGFSTYISTEDLYRVLLRYSRGKGWNKLALITSTDATGQDAEKGIRAAMDDPESSALKLVADVTFNPTDVTVSAQVEKLRSANPDVVIAWTTGSAIGNVFKAMSNLELKIPVATTTANMTYAQMDQYKNFLPATLLFPASEWPPHGPEIQLPAEVVAKQEKFFAAFKQAGVKPDGPATYVWDPAMILIDSLKALGPDATATAVRDYINRLAAYPGINGTYNYIKTPQRGLDQTDTVVTQWDPKVGGWSIVSEPGGKPATGK